MAFKPCSECGKRLKVNAKSAPLPRCHACRKVAREAGESGRMPPGYISPSRRMECAGCGKTISRTRTSAAIPYCIGCRRAGKAPSSAQHGTDRRYKSGCRCDVCREGTNARRRDYRAKRSAEGRPLHTARRTVDRSCENCGDRFGARVDAVKAGRGRFCSVRCMDIEINGVDTGDPSFVRRDRFRPSAVLRLAVMERDGWVCQLCGEPVDVSAKPGDRQYPTLDHVKPRSRGGADTLENLQCAHRGCNSKKGAGYGDSLGDVAVAA